MNPVFLLLVILGGTALWALLNIFFPIIGAILVDMYRDIKRNLNKKEDEE